MTAAGEGASGDEAELRREGDRIAELIEDLATIGGEPVRQRAEELVRRLIHLYGAGLSGLMQIFGGAGFADEVKARLAADPLVSSLLLLHGLHPDPTAGERFDPDAGPAAARAKHGDGLVQIGLDRGRRDRDPG